MLRARSGLRRLRPGAAPLQSSALGRLLPPDARRPPPPSSFILTRLLLGQSDRAFSAAKPRSRLVPDPLARISAVVDYGSSVQVRLWG